MRWMISTAQLRHFTMIRYAIVTFWQDIVLILDSPKKALNVFLTGLSVLHSVFPHFHQIKD